MPNIYDIIKQADAPVADTAAKNVTDTDETPEAIGRRLQIERDNALSNVRHDALDFWNKEDHYRKARNLLMKNPGIAQWFADHPKAAPLFSGELVAAARPGDQSMKDPDEWKSKDSDSRFTPSLSADSSAIDNKVKLPKKSEPASSPAADAAGPALPVTDPAAEEKKPEKKPAPVDQRDPDTEYYDYPLTEEDRVIGTLQSLGDHQAAQKIEAAQSSAASGPSLAESAINGWRSGRYQLELSDLNHRVMAEDRDYTPQEEARIKQLNSKIKALEDADGGMVFSSAEVLNPMIRGMDPQDMAIGSAAALTVAMMAKGAMTGAAAGTAIAPGVGTLGGAIVGAAGAMGLGTALGWGARYAMAMSTARQTAADNYRTNIENGVPRGAARAIAIGVGGTSALIEQGLIEKLGGVYKKVTMSMLNKVFTKRVQEAGLKLAAPSFGGALYDFGKATAAGALVYEPGEEVLQEVVSIGGEELGKKLTEDLSKAAPITPEEAAERLADTYLSTVKSVALLQFLGGSPFLMHNLRRARAAESNQQYIESLVNYAKESKAAKIDPPTAEDFITSQAKDHNADKIYIEASMLRQAMNETGATDEQLAAVAPDVKAQLDRIEKDGTGGDVEVDTGKFAVELAPTNLGLNLKQHIRLAPDAMSIAEAVKAREAARKLSASWMYWREHPGEAAKNELNEQGQQVYQSYIEQLTAANKALQAADPKRVPWTSEQIIGQAKLAALTAQSLMASTNLPYETVRAMLPQVQAANPQEQEAKPGEAVDKGNGVYQVSLNTPTGPQDALVTVHKISKENLWKAFRLGGLPMPSLGITKAVNPYKGFGEIALIGTSGMVDPENGVPVFSQDAYTGRFPRVEPGAIIKDKIDALQRDVQEAQKGLAEAGRESWRDFGWSMTNGDGFENIRNFLIDSLSGRVLYLKEHGIDFAPVLRDPDEELPAVAKDPKFRAFALQPNDRAGELIDDALNGRDDIAGELYAAAGGSPSTSKHLWIVGLEGTPAGNKGGHNSPAWLQAAAEAVEKIQQIEAWKKRRPGQKRVDVEASKKLALEKIQSLPGGWDALVSWAGDKSLSVREKDQLVDERTGESAPATLQNITEWMANRYSAARQASEYGGHVSNRGSLQAAGARRFRSLREMGANRGLISNSDDTWVQNYHLDERLRKVVDKIKEGLRAANPEQEGREFRAFEMLAQLVADGNAPTLEEVRNVLGREIDVGKQPGLDAEVQEFLSDLQASRTDYFEAKPLRAVKFNEFRGAVVPKGTPQELIDALKANGIEVTEYDGSNAGQAAAIGELSRRLNSQYGDVLFQRGTGGGVHQVTGRGVTGEFDAEEQKKWLRWTPKTTGTKTVDVNDASGNSTTEQVTTLAGAPDGVYLENYGDLCDKLQSATLDGKVGRFWYENSGAWVYKFVGGDVKEAEKLIQLIAIYSPQMQIGPNLLLAVRAYAWHKAGMPEADLHLKTGPQDAKAREVLYHGGSWAGRKTNSFYQNLMYTIVKNHEAECRAAGIKVDDFLRGQSTIDMWMMRAFGYNTDSTVDDKGSGRYAFCENTLRRVTATLNSQLNPGEAPWTAHQVQAAIWTSTMARYQIVKPDADLLFRDKPITLTVKDTSDAGKAALAAMEAAEKAKAEAEAEAKKAKAAGQKLEPVEPDPNEPPAAYTNVKYSKEKGEVTFDSTLAYWEPAKEKPKKNEAKENEAKKEEGKAAESKSKGKSKKKDEKPKGRWRRRDEPAALREEMKLWHELAEKVPREAVVDFANKNARSYATEFERMAQVITWEAMPSPSIPGVEPLLNASYELRRKFTDAVARIFDGPDGKSELAKMLGIDLDFSVKGDGGYERMLSPNMMTCICQAWWDGAGEPAKDHVRAFCRVIQYVTRQNAVPFFRIENKPALMAEGSRISVTNTITGSSRYFDDVDKARAYMEQKNADSMKKTGKAAFKLNGGKLTRSYVLRFSELPSPDTLKKLLDKINAVAGDGYGLSRISDTNVLVANFKGGDENLPFGLSDKEFLQRMKQLPREELEALGVEDAYAGCIDSEYGHDHDWSKDPDGNEILNLLGVGNGNKQQGVGQGNVAGGGNGPHPRNAGIRRDKLDDWRAAYDQTVRDYVEAAKAEAASRAEAERAAAARSAEAGGLGLLHQGGLQPARELTFTERIARREFASRTPQKWIEELTGRDENPLDAVSGEKIALMEQLLRAQDMDDARAILSNAEKSGVSAETREWYQRMVLNPLERDKGMVEFVQPDHPLTPAEAKADAAYAACVRAGDTAGAQKLVDAKLREMGFDHAVPEQCGSYRLRLRPAPHRTIRVYKTFYVDKAGRPSALFVGGGDQIPMGVWLDALDCWHFTDPKNGRKYVPSFKNPNGQGGTTGDLHNFPPEVRQYLLDHGFITDKNKSGKVISLKYRPGWHAGDLPFFPQGGKQDKASNYGNVHRWNQVVFECEFDADEDFTSMAQSQAKARKKNGGLYAKEGDLEYIPDGGYYRYSTNPLIAGKEDKLGNWMISGSMKVVRAMTQQECDDLLTSHGMKPQEWEGGTLDLSKLGVTEGEQDESARKTVAPITYDEGGKVIPLSMRFNAKTPGVLYQRVSAQAERKPAGAQAKPAERKLQEEVDDKKPAEALPKDSEKEAAATAKSSEKETAEASPKLAEEKLKEEVADWAKRIDAMKGMPRKMVLMLKQTPLVMHLIGADFRELYATSHFFARVFTNKDGDEKTLTKTEMKQIPAALADPIAVFEQDSGRPLFLLNVRLETGSHVVVPVEFNGERDHTPAIVNVAVTAFPKQTNNVPRYGWMRKFSGRELYVNRVKFKALLDEVGDEALKKAFGEIVKEPRATSGANSHRGKTTTPQRRIYTEVDLKATREENPELYQRQAQAETLQERAAWAPDEALIEKAKANFGVTKNPDEAFYVLPDGAMLDGSGRHWGGSERDVAGTRQVDHGDIAEVMDNDGAQAMYDWMARSGAMRFDRAAGIASIARPPTPQQLSLLGRTSKGKYLALSFNTPEGRIVDDAELESASPKKIEDFFKQAQGKMARGEISGALAQQAAEDAATLESSIIRGAYDPSKNKIYLTQDADLSTFAHEMSHAYLTQLFNLAAVSDRTSRVVRDANILLKAFGLSSLEEFATLPATPEGMERYRKIQEWWAYNTEIYLSRGSSPDPKAEGVLRRFGSWIRSVYRSYVGGAQSYLNLQFKNEFGEDMMKMSDEVRGVMERMYSAESAFDRQVEMSGLDGFFKRKPDGMSDQEWADYLEAMDTARIDGVDKLQEASLAQMKWLSNARGKILKEIQKEWDTARKAAKEAAEEAVHSMKCMNLLDDLRDGGTKLESEETERQGLKFDKAWLETQKYTPEQIDKLRRLGLVTSEEKGGFPPDALANLVGDRYGITTGRELIDMLMTVPDDVGALVSQLTDQYMMQEHSEMQDPKWREARVIEALHTEARMRMVALELKFFSKASSGRVFMHAAKIAAHDILMRTKMSGISAKQYQLIAGRCANNAIKLLQQGDRQGAINAKHQQLLNMYMAREALEIDKNRDRLNKIRKRAFQTDKKLSGARDMNLVMATRAIFAAYSMAPDSIKDPLDCIAPIEKYAPEDYPFIRDLVEPHLGVGMPLEQMTAQQMTDLLETVKALWSQSRAIKQLELGDQRVELNDALAEMEDEIMRFPKKTAGTKSTMTEKEKRGNALLSFGTSLKRVEFWCARMDGDNPSKPFTRYIYRPVSAACTAYRLANAQYVDKYRLLLKPMVTDWAKAGKISGKKFGIDYTFTKFELIGALLHSGNDSNLQKLLAGRDKEHPWGEWVEGENGSAHYDATRWWAFIDYCVQQKILTKADFNYVQGVWDLLEETKPLAQRAFKKCYGRYFEEIENRDFSITFPDGSTIKYKGGYVPARTSKDLDTNASRNVELEELSQNSQTWMMPVVQPGFTKSRVPRYAQPLELDPAGLEYHIGSVLRFAYIQPAAAQTLRILNNAQFKDMLHSIDRYAMSDMLMPWLKRACTQSISDGQSSPVLRKINSLRALAGMNMMAGNIANALQQITGLSISMTLVSPRALAHGLVTYIKHPFKTARMIAEMSDFMKTRYDDRSFEFQSELQRYQKLKVGPVANAKEWVKNHAYILQQIMQNIVDSITWIGAYDEAMKNPDGHVDMNDADAMKADAVKRADSVIRRTQSSFNPEDIATMEAGSPLKRFFLVFYNYFNMQLNLLGSEGGKALEAKQYGRFAYVVATALWLPSVLADGMYDLLFSGSDSGDDDDDGLMDALRLIVGAPIRNAANFVPMGGAISSYFGGQLVKAKVPGASMLYDPHGYLQDKIISVPGAKLLEDAGKAITTGTSLLGDKPNPVAATRRAFDVFTLISGLPTNWIAKPVGYQVGVESGKYKPKTTGDYVKGLMSGRDVNQK